MKIAFVLVTSSFFTIMAWLNTYIGVIFLAAFGLVITFWLCRRMNGNVVFRSMSEFRRREIDAHLFGASQTENRHPANRSAPLH